MWLQLAVFLHSGFTIFAYGNQDSAPSEEIVNIANFTKMIDVETEAIVPVFTYDCYMMCTTHFC